MKMTSEKNTWKIIKAWSVHLYTSLGLPLGLLSIFAIIRGDAKTAFLLNWIAIFIDATDGRMARSWEVKKWTPGFDGRKLDDITDYLNYAFIPLIFAYQFKMVDNFGLWVLGFVAIAAAYGFCQVSAKTVDNSFLGFPNYWNYLVLYLFIFQVPQVANAVILFIFGILVFVPINYISHLTEGLEKPTVILGGLFSLSVLIITINLDNPPMLLVWLSLIYPIYYVSASLIRQVKLWKA
jgi:phosphatidylcholine synthase